MVKLWDLPCSEKGRGDCVLQIPWNMEHQARKCGHTLHQPAGSCDRQHKARTFTSHVLQLLFPTWYVQIPQNNMSISEHNNNFLKYFNIHGVFVLHWFVITDWLLRMSIWYFVYFLYSAKISWCRRTCPWTDANSCTDIQQSLQSKEDVRLQSPGFLVLQRDQERGAAPSSIMYLCLS